MDHKDTQNIVFLLGGHDLEMLEILRLLDRHHIHFDDKGLDWSNARLFGLKAYSKSLKRFIKVAIWYPIEGRMDKWQIYFSTDESMTTRDVIDCYRTRFQLEFCFRDAKSHAGLNDCQARDLRRLEFHFNASFASINLAKAACKGLKIPFPISSCKSMIHNAYMLERFFACPVCDRTHKLLTNFSKNWFYLHPEPLRPGKKLTNY